MRTKKNTLTQQSEPEHKVADAIQELATVLHGQKSELTDIEVGIDGANKLLQNEEPDLDRLMYAVEMLGEQVQVDIESTIPVASTIHNIIEPIEYQRVNNWNELIEKYAPSSLEMLSLDSLLSPAQVAQIDARYLAPLKRDQWKIPYDYAAVFGAAVIGAIADIFCSPINNPLAKYFENFGMDNPNNHGSHTVYKWFGAMQERILESGLGDKFPWLQKIATIDATHDNLPIDYKGSGFGGPNHRILSSGHDLLCFFAAIWQIKNGQFVGLKVPRGKGYRIPELIVKGAQDWSGSIPYKTYDLSTAIILYGLHMMADFVTKTSLPIPGATLLRLIPSQELRVNIDLAYKGGYNMRHVVGQSVTPLVTGLIIHIYHLLMYRIPKLYEKKEDIDDEAVKGLKLNEMLAAAHTMVAGFNVGKVAITGDWFSLNLPQLLTAVSELYSLGIKTWRRYDLFARVERNQIILDQGWASLENYCQIPLNTWSIDWPSKPMVIT